MAITLGKVEGRITIPSSAQYLTCTDASGGPTAVTVTAGDYYWSSADSDADDMVDQLTDDINAVMGETWTVAHSLGEGGTGRMNITCDGATCTVTWNNTDFRDLCGYTGNLSGSIDYTSPNQSLAVWLPDGPPRSPYGLSDGGVDECDWTSVESPAGHVQSIVYQRRTIQMIEWMGVSRAKTRIDGESTTNESFQKFYREVILAENTFCTGCPIRIYPDADADGTYTTYRVSGKVPEPRQVRENWIELWNVALPRLVKVP